MIFENTQPPIVEESVFLIVQNIRKSRRRPTKMGDMGIFSGLLYCAECGGKMYQCRATNFTEEQKYFICSTYRKGKDLCTTHSIKNVVLYEIVLKNLREAIDYVTEYEAEFVQEAADSRLRERDAEFSRKRETLSRAESRIAELDNLFKHLYEDNVTGKLSDERMNEIRTNIESIDYTPADQREYYFTAFLTGWDFSHFKNWDWTGNRIPESEANRLRQYYTERQKMYMENPEKYAVPALIKDDDMGRYSPERQELLTLLDDLPDD